MCTRLRPRSADLQRHFRAIRQMRAQKGAASMPSSTSHATPSKLMLTRSAVRAAKETAARRQGGRYINIPRSGTRHLPLVTRHCLSNRHTRGLEMPVTPVVSTKPSSLIATDLGGAHLRLSTIYSCRDHEKKQQSYFRFPLFSVSLCPRGQSLSILARHSSLDTRHCLIQSQQGWIDLLRKLLKTKDRKCN